MCTCIDDCVHAIYNKYTYLYYNVNGFYMYMCHTSIARVLGACILKNIGYINTFK